MQASRMGWNKWAVVVAALVGVLILGDADSARGDVAPRPRRKQTQVMQAPVRLQYQKLNEGVARIIIPRSMVEQALERVGSAPLTVPVSPTTPGSPDAPVTSAWVPSTTGTIVAGVALALALISIPFVLRRRPAVRLAATAAVMLVVGVAAGWSVAYGDLLPGSKGNRPPPPPENIITIEIGGEGETVQLWVKPQAK